MKPVWHDRKVVVMMGSGGVGKTTAAASMAVAAATSGVPTLVMTIDPAKRLANAMGLRGLGNAPYAISKEVAAAAGIELRAPLWALMLDVKRAFDELISRLAPTEERRRQIFQNKLYQQLSTVLVGAVEYAACEKLHELYDSGAYGLIVVDTPPSQNAQDFFDAPNRLLGFLDHEGLQWLLRPLADAEGISQRVLDFGGSMIMKALGKMAGGETLKEMLHFVNGFKGMYAGFRQRSDTIKELFHSNDVAFIAVCSTQPGQPEALGGHLEVLRRDKLPVRGVVINRVSQTSMDASTIETLMNEPTWTPEEAALLKTALGDLQNTIRSTEVILEKLRAEAAGLPRIELPELLVDAHNLRTLGQLHHAWLAAPKTNT